MTRLKCSDIPDQEIIDACNQFHANLADTPDVMLAHKYPVKLIMTKMQRLMDRGILECGVSVRTAWVVKKVESK